MKRRARRRSVRRLAAAASAVLAGIAIPSGAATAAESTSVDIVTVDSTKSPQVTLTVAPPDALADTPLTAEAFELKENGEVVPVKVAPADAGTAAGALEVVLVFDTSGSMVGDPMAAAKQAAAAFVTGMPAGTKVALVSFSDKAVVSTPMSADTGRVARALSGLEARGETALYDAVMTGLGLFSDAESTRHAMVVLSDGGDTASAQSLDGIISALRPSGVEFTAVELVTPEYNGDALHELAGNDGLIVSVDDPDKLVAGYESVATKLFHRYELTYRTQVGGATDVVLSVDWDGVSDTAERTITLPELEGVAGPASAPKINEEPGLLGSKSTVYVAAFAFFLGLSFLLVKLALKPRERRVQLSDRFGLAGKKPSMAAVSDLAERASQAAGRHLERTGRESSMYDTLERAGIDLRPGEYVVAVGFAAFMFLALGVILFGPLAGLVAAVVPVVAGPAYVSRKATKRRSNFGEQLPDTLQLLTGSLRAGHSILQAMDAVAANAPSPTQEEFQRLVVETRLGRDLPDALNAMNDRVGSVDFQWFVQALAIHREVGGDLAEILDTVANTVRDRQKLRRHVKTLSAEGRLSAIILFILPLVIGGLVNIINPGYIGPLFSTGLGIGMVVMGTLLMTGGFFWLRRIIRLDY